jgi:hypothetical protein
VAFSRVLDTTEVLVALNLDDKPRNDFILMDSALTAAGAVVTDLISGTSATVAASADGRAFIQAPLEARTLAIFKQK